MLDADQIADLLRTASVRSACAEERERLQAALSAGIASYDLDRERKRLLKLQQDKRYRERQKKHESDGWIGLNAAQKRQIALRAKPGVRLYNIASIMGIDVRKVKAYLEWRARQT